MKKKGFTLIELVIVISIMAILTGIGIPTFQNLLDKNKLNSALNQVEADLRKAQTMAKASGADYEVLFIPDKNVYYIYEHRSTSTAKLKETITLPEVVKIYTNTAPDNKIVYYGAYATSETTGGTITFKTSRGNTGKVIVATITGRISIER